MITDDEANMLLKKKSLLIMGKHYHAILDEAHPEGYTRVHMGEHSRLVGYRYILSTECNYIPFEQTINHRRSICGSCEYSQPQKNSIIDRRCVKCERQCFILVITAKHDSQCPEGHWGSAL